MNKKSGISSAHIDYIDNRTAALLIKTPKYTRITIYLIMALMLILVIWASFAKIDKTTSGTGQVIPSTQRQIVQNLEGGIIKQMYVHEGEKVKKSQKLVLIDDTRFLSDFRGRQQQVLSLKADILRLESLLTTITINQDDIGEHWQQSVIVSEKPLNFDDNQWLQDTDLITRQQAQYHDALANIENQLSLVAKQVKQKNQQLAEAKERLKTLASNLHLSKKQYQMSKPLAKQGIVSEVELIKLQRQINDNQKDYTTTELQLPQLKESIQENILKRIDIALKFRDSVQEKLNTNNDKLADLSEQQVSIKDKVNRTMVTSPVNGIVQKIYVSTIGGVIQPGMPLIEIVPSGDSLEIEVKISPSNIAFLRPGLDAMVKLTAYDFATFGGLHGKVTSISADTTQDKKGNDFYLVRIKTDTNYILSQTGAKLPIIPGMTANVDIITGKRTILSYLLNPLLRLQQTALTE